MTVYHLSHPHNRESIFRQGLIPKARNGININYAASIFVSTSKESRFGFAADFVGYEDGLDVWKFEIEKEMLQRDEFSGHKNHFFISTPVPSHKVMLDETF